MCRDLQRALHAEGSESVVADGSARFTAREARSLELDADADADADGALAA